MNERLIGRAIPVKATPRDSQRLAFKLLKDVVRRPVSTSDTSQWQSVDRRTPS